MSSPKSETKPQLAHTIKLKPTEPERSSTPFVDTNMPEPKK